VTRRTENIHPKTATSARQRASIAREVSLDILEKVRLGKYAERALSDELYRTGLRPEDRALATELVYGVLRWRDRLDAVMNRCLERPQHRISHSVRQILRMAIYQIMFLDRVPHHAAVHEAVIQATSRFGKRTGSFVNALVRNVIRRTDSVDPQPSDDPASLAVYYSHPLWLVERWSKEFGIEITRKILIHNNSRGQLVLRVNKLKSTRKNVEELLKNHGVTARTVSGMPDALILTSGQGEVASLPGFEEGLFVVQDLASQMVAPVLGAIKGERILDACAAPGGKTAHLAALLENNAQVVAVDSSAQRLEEARLNLQRLGVTCVETVCGDSSDGRFILGLGTFDRVLLDAPCSNLGVLRHNPEAKYRTSPEHLSEFAVRQRKLLGATASCLEQGGVLLYAVCTNTPEETTEIVGGFLTKHPNFREDRTDKAEVPYASVVSGRGFLRTFPPPDGEPLDGFFAARFCRL
jgi:16S rRNA (cytosine967-C5)-methyltransferase